MSDTDDLNKNIINDDELDNDGNSNENIIDDANNENNNLENKNAEEELVNYNYEIPTNNNNSQIQNDFVEENKNKVLKFQDESVVNMIDENNQLVIVENNDNAVVPVQNDNNDNVSEMDDSGFNSRPESTQETMKRRIYKQALSINQVAYNTPKEKRIHESVTKVFGNDDPPPGFGLIYPKYYYLEQKRPQPMSPLKVWRGFNGNIYFEPIQFNHIQTSDTINQQQDQPPLFSQRSQRNLAITDSKENTKAAILRAKTDGEILTRKSRTTQRSNNTTNRYNTASYAIHSSKLNTEKTNLNNDNDDNYSNDDEFVFITQQNNQEPVEYHRNFTSSSSFVQQNQLQHSRQQILTTPFGNNNNLLNEQHLQVMPLPATPKVIKNLVSVRASGAQSHKKKEAPILPNPNAPNFKYKGPLKGLAYKEVKHRIIDKASTDSLAYYTSDLDQAYIEQLNKLHQNDDHGHYDLINTINKYDNKKRLDYKNMMKKIRKGITTNISNNIFTSSNNNLQQTPPQQQQQQPSSSQQQLPLRLSRNDRTTSAYISYTRNRIQLNKEPTNLMLNSINDNNINASVSVDPNFNNTNSSLQVKGDKITIDLIIAEPPYTSLARTKSNIVIDGKNLINNTSSAKSNSSNNTTVDTYNTLKHVIGHNHKSMSARMRSGSNLSLGLKSLSSSYSIIGLAGKRINPTPDFDHHSNSSNIHNNSQSQHINLISLVHSNHKLN